MSVAALVAWVVTAGGGLVMLCIWLAHGGHRHQHDGGTRFPARVVLAHVALASIGLACWGAFVASDEGALAWVASALLVPVGVLGSTMLTKWLGGRASARAAAQAEQRFPTAVVVAHGAGAFVTGVLVLIAAATAT